MSSNFPGRIQIGGKLPRSLLPRFVELANQGGAGFDWASGEDLTEKMILDEIADEDGKLSLMDGEACFGRFEDFETWLAANKMSYVVTSDSYCEYEATINGVVNGEPFSIDANQSGDPMVGMEIVTSALASLKAGNIFDAIATLSAAAKEIPELPRFEIVDDPPAPKPKRKRKKRK